MPNFWMNRFNGLQCFALSLGLGTWGLVNACAAQPPAIAQATALDADTEAALVQAIEDEYHARAYYQAVIDQFGAVLPFRNLVQAEDRHAQFLAALFEQYGLPVPEDVFAGHVSVPDTLVEACQAGVEAEIANAEMYDQLLSTGVAGAAPDVRATFQRLQQASQDNHLAALQGCVESGGAAMPAGRGPNRS